MANHTTGAQRYNARAEKIWNAAYELAARKAGWTHETARFTGNPSFYHAETGRRVMLCGGWRELCLEFDLLRLA